MPDPLASRLCALAAQPLPDRVKRAAQRTLLNAGGAAIGASRHAVIEALVGLARAHGGTALAPLPGRAERTDVYYAALIGGTSAQLLAFDDTQLATVLHLGAAPFGALLAIAATHEASGTRALAAYALGCEVSMRIALALGRAHSEAGWDVTGTAGVVGASVTAGLALGLDERALGHAIGIGASETVGHREAFGTASETLHGGKAAANGVIAALFAQGGFTSPPSLRAPRGYFTAFAGNGPVDPERVNAELGARWELESDAAVAPDAAEGDDELRASVARRVNGVLPGRAAALVAAVEDLGAAPNARALIAALTGAAVVA